MRHMPSDVFKFKMVEGDHYEVYRGVPIWISKEYMDRGRRWDVNVINDARDTVDYYLERIAERSRK
jgi:hypothetical protein